MKTNFRNIAAAILVVAGVSSTLASENAAGVSSISASEMSEFGLILEVENELMVVEDWMLDAEKFNLKKSETSKETLDDITAGASSISASEILKLGRLELGLDSELMILEDWMLNIEHFNPKESKSQNEAVVPCSND